MSSERSGIGFRVKTGYASAIVLAGPVATPRFICRELVLLADLDDDDSRQPYHAGLHRGSQVGAAVVKQARRDAERRAGAALAGLMQRAVAPRGIGVVVGSNVDPDTLGNLHIRAHALEGRFYREVLERAAEQAGLYSLVLLERSGFDVASDTLGCSRAELKAGLTRIGTTAGRPWRRDEQLAALVAWLVLASHDH